MEREDNSCLHDQSKNGCFGGPEFHSDWLDKKAGPLNKPLLF